MAKEYFDQGFFFGIGFIFAVSVFFIALFLLIKAVKFFEDMIISDNRDKLTIDILENHVQKLIKKDRFEEVSDFKDYIERFRNSEPINDFFDKYKLVKKVDENHISLFKKPKVRYSIKKKSLS